MESDNKGGSSRAKRGKKRLLDRESSSNSFEFENSLTSSLFSSEPNLDLEMGTDSQEDGSLTG